MRLSAAGRLSTASAFGDDDMLSEAGDLQPVLHLSELPVSHKMIDFPAVALNYFRDFSLVEGDGLPAVDVLSSSVRVRAEDGFAAMLYDLPAVDVSAVSDLFRAQKQAERESSHTQKNLHSGPAQESASPLTSEEPRTRSDSDPLDGLERNLPGLESQEEPCLSATGEVPVPKSCPAFLELSPRGADSPGGRRKGSQVSFGQVSSVNFETGAEDAGRGGSLGKRKRVGTGSSSSIPGGGGISALSDTTSRGVRRKPPVADLEIQPLAEPFRLSDSMKLAEAIFHVEALEHRPWKIWTLPDSSGALSRYLALLPPLQELAVLLKRSMRVRLGDFLSARQSSAEDAEWSRLEDEEEEERARMEAALRKERARIEETKLLLGRLSASQAGRGGPFLEGSLEGGAVEGAEDGIGPRGSYEIQGIFRNEDVGGPELDRPASSCSGRISALTERNCAPPWLSGRQHLLPPRPSASPPLSSPNRSSSSGGNSRTGVLEALATKRARLEAAHSRSPDHLVQECHRPYLKGAGVDLTGKHCPIAVAHELRGPYSPSPKTRASLNSGSRLRKGTSPNGGASWESNCNDAGTSSSRPGSPALGGDPGRERGRSSSSPLERSSERSSPELRTGHDGRSSERDTRGARTTAQGMIGCVGTLLGPS